MPKRFSVSLPKCEQRLKILSLVRYTVLAVLVLKADSSPQVLRDTKLDPSFQLTELAERTEGYSGSDLKELCRNAAMIPMRELMRRAGGNKVELTRIHEEGVELRPLVLGDFFQADGTSALPPPDLSIEAVLEKLASS